MARRFDFEDLADHTVVATSVETRELRDVDILVRVHEADDSFVVNFLEARDLRCADICVRVPRVANCKKKSPVSNLRDEEQD